LPEFPQHTDVLSFSKAEAIENEEKDKVAFYLFRVLIIHG